MAASRDKDVEALAAALHECWQDFARHGGVDHTPDYWRWMASVALHYEHNRLRVLTDEVARLLSELRAAQ